MSSFYDDVKHGDSISSGWGQAVEDALGSGNPAQGATYVLFKDGSDYQARNGETGKIDFEDDSAIHVLNSVTDALPSRGKISFKDDIFYFDTPWEIEGKNNFEIVGDGKAYLRDRSNSTSPILKISKGSGNAPQRITLRNLMILRDPSYVSSGDLLELDNVSYGKFENLYLWSSKGRGIYLHDSCYFNTFVNTRIFDVPKGIHLEAAQGSPNVNDNWFFGTTIGVKEYTGVNADYGVRVEYCNINGFFGLEIEPKANYTPKPNGVEIYGTIGTYIHNLRVGEKNSNYALHISGDSGAGYPAKHTTVMGLSATFPDVAAYIDEVELTHIDSVYTRQVRTNSIVITSNASRTTIVTEKEYDTSTGISDSGTDSKFINCAGYVTENSGSDSIANGTTSKVVAHGLDVTPSAEHFTIIGKENPANSVGTVWVDNIGAANFTVNVENDPGASGWDFGWKVIVL